MKAPSLLLAGASAVVCAWLLAGLFSLPLTTGPVDVDAGRGIAERRLGEERVERAVEFRQGQRRTAVAQLALSLAILTALALWRPAPLRRLLAWLGRRPALGAAACGAGISLLLSLIALPLSLARLDAGRDAGLIVQSVSSWLGDYAAAAGIGALVAAVGALLAAVAWRRLRGLFWTAAALAAIAFAVITVWLWPSLVSPLFNDFEELPPGPARDEVTRLARRAGVDVGRVEVVDAGRRSVALNAYVDGIGSTRRVVIYDNSLKAMNRPALRALVAHELTHAAENDMRRGLLYAVLIIPLGALTVQLGAARLAGRTGDEPGSPGSIPALALMLSLMTLLLSVPGNWLSRQVEANADAGAISLVGERAFDRLQIDLARRNLADPDPPALWQSLFGTHPTTVERLGMAAARGRSLP